MAHVELEYVTVAFCDLVASTEQATALAPEVWAARLDEYFQVVEKTMVEYGGRVEKFIGDAVCAIFSADHRGQRAAPSALRAARSVITTLHRDGLDVRVGLSTGYAAVSDRSSTFAVGPSMNVAARLQNHAASGEVIVDAATWVLVSGYVAESRAVVLDLKGVEGPVNAHIVTRLTPSGRCRDRPGLVGRQYELRSLARLVDSQPPGVGVAQVVGPTGVGKSHLVHELIRQRESHGQATLVLEHDPYRHEGGLLPLYRLADACRRSSDEATIFVVPQSGEDPSGSESLAGHRVEDVWREVVAELSAWLDGRSLLVVQDDFAGASHVVHDLQNWLKPLVEDAPARCVLVLRVTRERDETVPGTLVVPPMTEAECRELVRRTAPDAEHKLGLDLLQVSGGNPLFVLQLARHGSMSSGDLPLATLEAVLGERIAALSVDSRSVLLLVAASSGRLLVEDLEACLDGTDVRDRLAGCIEELVQHEMIDDPDEIYGRLVLTSTSLGHVVQRRATRASLADVHRRLALLWRERRSRRSAHAEIEAGHWLAWLRAHQMAGRAGCPDTEVRLAVEAVGESVRLAILRGEPVVAREWLDDPALEAVGDRSDLHLLDALAHGYLGSPDAARLALERAEVAHETRATLESRALLQWARTILLGDGDEIALAALVSQARDEGDHAALATAQFTSGLVKMRSGDYDSARQLLVGAWSVGRDASTMCDVDIRTNLALADAYSSAPISEVMANLDRVSEGLEPGSLASLALRASRAQVLHMQGDVAAAHAQIDSLLPEFREREILSGVSQLHGLSAWMYVREARLAQAVRSWREEHAVLAAASTEAALPVAALIDVATWKPSLGLRAPREWTPSDHFQELTALVADAVAVPSAQCVTALRSVVAELEGGISLGAHHEVLLLTGHVARLLGVEDVAHAVASRVAEISEKRGDRGITCG